MIISKPSSEKVERKKRQDVEESTNGDSAFTVFIMYVFHDTTLYIYRIPEREEEEAET